MPDAIVVADRDGRIVELNVLTLQLFGYAPNELLGELVEVLLPERFRDGHVGEREQYDHAPRVRPMGAGRELLAQHKDGSEFPVAISLAPYQSPEGPVVVTVIREVNRHHDVG